MIIKTKIRLELKNLLRTGSLSAKYILFQRIRK